MAPLLLSVAAAEGDAWRKVELRRGAEQAGLKKLCVKFRVKLRTYTWSFPILTVK